MIQTSILSRFFSSATLNRLIAGRSAPVFQLARMQLQQPGLTTNQSVIEAVYSEMARSYRNEYYYKNMLLNKILLGRHSINTSVALRELPVAGSILDFLIINGIGQVYEIKTGLDNLERLPGQLRDYYQAFSTVNVVTDASHLAGVTQAVSDLPVGIIELTKRQQLSVKRLPQVDESHLDIIAMFKIMRKSEFESILLKYFGDLPHVNAFEYYDACRNMMAQLSPVVVQRELLRALKQRTQIQRFASEFDQVPQSLKEIVYFSNYGATQYQQLSQFLTAQA